MTSDKKSAALLADLFVKKGLKYIVISPGSRNAPIIISFANHPGIKAISIVDERSAAFFALGMAQQLRETVAIACTSGTAALNYAPAIAEAYYQKVPLLVITADRPEEMIDQGDGQTIRQNNLYKNYSKASFELKEEFRDDADFSNAVKLINKAINLTCYPDYGPVHMNLPFSEPIYNQVESHNWRVKNIQPKINPYDLTDREITSFSDSWNKYKRKLVIAGMMDDNTGMKRILQRITGDPSVVLLSETTSNLDSLATCPCIDNVISTIKPDEAKAFKPDLLVTFGGHVISKMVKEFIRINKPVEHWHIDPVDYQMNTYQCLTSGIRTDPYTFFNEIKAYIKPQNSDYQRLWTERHNRSSQRHSEFLSRCEFSDLKVFETILNFLPENSMVQLGNSTPVRYMQLFKPVKNLLWYSNRGTSGIDGTVSTAAGASYVSLKMTTLITGDLGFFYDSNALMHNHWNSRLRIIIINNGGGGIFRFIPGPEQTGHLHTFFETRHSWKSEFIAQNFGIPYSRAENLEEAERHLSTFYDHGRDVKPAILEIVTPNDRNGEVLKDYFKYLNH